jgi:hypothetical protein
VGIGGLIWHLLPMIMAAKAFGDRRAG